MRKGLLIGMVVAVLVCGFSVNKQDVSTTAEQALSSALKWYEKSFSPWLKSTVIPAVQKAIDSLPGTISRPENYLSRTPGTGKQSAKGPQALKTRTLREQSDPEEVELTGAVKEKARVRMLELINAERAKAGSEPLQFHNVGDHVATIRGEDMVKRNYFSHNPPGETYADFLGNRGMNYEAMLRREGMQDFFDAWSENIHESTCVPPRFIEVAHKDLMSSPGHRRNILEPEFTHIGIGIVKGYPDEEGQTHPDGVTVVQIFLGKPKH